MIGNTHLTPSDPELEAKTRITVPGMAHWAESDSGQTCGGCEHWHNAIDEKENKVARRCLKYTALMGGVFGPRIPCDTKACKYFAPEGGRHD